MHDFFTGKLATKGLGIYKRTDENTAGFIATSHGAGAVAGGKNDRFSADRFGSIVFGRIAQVEAVDFQAATFAAQQCMALGQHRGRFSCLFDTQAGNDLGGAGLDLRG